MKGNSNKTKYISIIVGFIIGAITYWFHPYSQLKILTSSIPYFWSFGAFFGSIILILLFQEKPPKIALLISFGVVLAVLLRIVYDITFWDKTSHNLAPFEIIFCGIITIPSAFIGAYAAYFIKKLKK